MLHDSAFEQDDEAFGPIATFDDLDRPSAEFSQRTTQLLASISTVTDQMAKPKEQWAYSGCYQRRTITIPNVGGMDDSRHDMTQRVGRDMPLASLDLLVRIINAWAVILSGINRPDVDDAH